MLRLNYISNTGRLVHCTVQTDGEGFDDWLQWFTKGNPQTNFFFTVDSTEIWED